MPVPATLLDEDAIVDLTTAILTACKAHCRSRPTGRTTVLEALNAIAYSAAAVIAGSGDVKSARGFFDAAVDVNLPNAVSAAAAIDAALAADA